MARGFHIPSFMVESDASGLQLVHWVRGVWGTRDPGADPSAAVVKLAAWLLADTRRIGTVEAEGIHLADVLGDRAPVSPEQGRVLHEISGGAIGLHDWSRPHSDAGIVPHLIPAPFDAGAAALTPAAVPASLDAAAASPIADRSFINELGNSIRIVIEGPASVSENIITPVEFDELAAAIASASGRLGETMPGVPLFRCAQGAGHNSFALMSSMGWTVTLDRAGAMAACEALALALRLRVSPLDRLGGSTLAQDERK